ncbi:MAG: MtrB/PioB family outer membrane beta-barrel protein [Desulfurivibrionaceae bacterium]
MKKCTYISALALMPLLYASGTLAADYEVTGAITPSVKGVNVNGSKAKFGEYTDPDSAITGGVEVNADADTGFVTFNAGDIGQDTQSYKAETGQYGRFKLDAFYNEIQHNNTFDAKTFYSGAGTNQLTSPLNGIRWATAPAPATWGNTFDYEVSRNQYGAGLKVDLLKPFFANFSVSREDREGLRPIGAGNTNYAAELPEPVDYQTDLMQAELGYGKDPYFVSAGYTHSKFDNAYDALYFTNIYGVDGVADNELVTLPPDNSYGKFDLKGRVKMPLKSALALGYSKAKAEADANVFESYNVSGVARTVTVGTDKLFNGQVDTTNYSAVLTSSPLNFLDGKLFYKNYTTQNKSDQISIVDNGEGGKDYSNDLFDYDKKSYGIEAGLKLPGHVTLTPSFSKVATEVARATGDQEYDDKIYGINAKWKGLDFMVANIGYERMDRENDATSVDTATPIGNTPTASVIAMSPYTRMYDTASQERDTYKFGIDLFPTDMLNLGFTVRHKEIDYNETGIGLTDQRDTAYGVSADFTPNDTVSFSAYVDYSVAKFELLQRQGTVIAANASPDDTVPTDAAYNVTTTQKDKSLDWGIGVNVNVIPKTLALRAQYDHTKSDGSADYTYGDNSAANDGIATGWTNDTIDYANWDDYKKDSLLLKATYSLSAQVDLTGGYAYEMYEYNDGHNDNYAYVYQTAATGVGYLSGAGSDPDYTANVVFLSAKYKF